MGNLLRMYFCIWPFTYLLTEAVMNKYNYIMKPAYLSSSGNLKILHVMASQKYCWPRSSWGGTCSGQIYFYDGHGHPWKPSSNAPCPHLSIYSNIRPLQLLYMSCTGQLHSAITRHHINLQGGPFKILSRSVMLSNVSTRHWLSGDLYSV